MLINNPVNGNIDRQELASLSSDFKIQTVVYTSLKILTKITVNRKG